MKSMHFLPVVGLAVTLLGCPSEPQKPAEAPKPAETAKPAAPASGPAQPAQAAAQPAAAAAAPAGGADEEANTIFTTRCSTCHGMEGVGDGPAAAALNPKPRSFKDGEWQKSVTDEHIATTIVKGGAAVGKSPLMAPNPDLESKPEVVKALVARVRKIGGGT